MPHYGVATTKDKLSSLIEKAVAGEEVVITRHGKPIAEIRVVSPRKADRQAAMDRVRAVREKTPPPKNPIPLHRFSEWLHEDPEI